MKNLIIIGGGPAALLLAAQIDTEKYKVTIIEKKKTVGRKFLVAGSGGLNLTYNAPIEELIEQYFPSEFIAPILQKYNNHELISWLNNHEIPTVIGSSKRVFPDWQMKPVEVLNKITDHIATKNVEIQSKTTWLGWNEEGLLCFDIQEDLDSDIVVFAMGGASWKVTGSDGNWSDKFADRGIKVEPFRAANCSFGVDWDKGFIQAHEGRPLKNIELFYNDHAAKGELLISKFGLEGNAIYALSQKIQETLLTEESTIVHLDLKPTMTSHQIKAKYQKSERTKITDILKNELNLDSTSVSLIKQFTDRETFMNIDLLADAIKAVPVVIKGADDMDNAISTLGGISLDEVDENLQLKKLPGSYAIGEMLDWYAPTGGYLLQGCFSMGAVLAKHLNGLGE